jgi:hypothetical protein
MQQMFDLPLYLITEILTEWLEFDSLLELDSAICNRAQRAAYLNVLQSSEFCVRRMPANRTLQYEGIKWFFSRATKIKRVHIDGDFISDEAIVQTFCRDVNARLEEVHSSKAGNSILRPLDFSFLQLHTLTVKGGCVFAARDLQTLLSSCSQTLKRLTVEHCQITGALLSESPLPDLQMLHLYNASMGQEMQRKLIVSSPSLRSFYCDDVRDGNACLEALAMHCPLLQVLSCYGTRSVPSLTRVLTACPKIEVVEFIFNVYEVHILTALQVCTKLKAFCTKGKYVKESAEFQLTLQARLSDLRHLFLCDCNFQSDTSILALAPYFGNLKTLELQNVGHVSQGALIELIRNLPCVEELNLDDAPLSDPVMQAIAAHCRHLRVFHLLHATGYTEDGILAFAQGCAWLRRLWVKPNDEVLTAGMLRFWQLLRPGLQVQHSYATYDSEFWATLWDVERDEVAVW